MTETQHFKKRKEEKIFSRCRKKDVTVHTPETRHSRFGGKLLQVASSKERGGWKKKKKMHMLAIGFPLKRKRNVWKLKYSNIPRVSNERKKTERKDVPVQQAQVGRQKETRLKYIHRESIDPWTTRWVMPLQKLTKAINLESPHSPQSDHQSRKNNSKCYAPEMIRSNGSQKKIQKQPQQPIHNE